MYDRKRKRTWSFAEALEIRALLARITVTSLDDNTVNDNETTLREAIAQADLTSAPDNIVFADGLSGVITLNSRLDIGASPLTIIGNGRSETIIDGNGADNIFRDDELRRPTTLRSMTLRNAETAVFADVVDDYYGGSSFIIEDAVITGNSSHGVNFGGLSYDDNAYPSTPAFTIRDSVISENGGRGVFLRRGQDSTIENTAIEDNSGGGVYSGDSGGYDFYAPRLTITGSTIRDNVASIGGGLWQEDGSVAIVNSLIEDNTAANGAGIYGTGTASDTLEIRESSITGNRADAIISAGGGVFSSGATEIYNSTISYNFAASGGGVTIADNMYSKLSMTNTTVTRNSAVKSGGGLEILGGREAEIISTVIAENNAANGPDIRVEGSDTPDNFSVASSFVGSNDGNSLSAPGQFGNQVGTAAAPLDSGLSPAVVLNELPVFVPFSDSPLLDAGSNPGNLTIDQIGENRVVGNGIDIGAIEAPLASNAIQRAGSQLLINGTDDNDVIGVNRFGEMIVAHLNNQFERFDDSDVLRISINGESGDDIITLRSVDQPTTLAGGNGNDTIKGGIGPDTIRGGLGNDNLRGTQGADLINGGSGNDLLRGQRGTDTLRGANGADTLIGDDGNDTLEGGNGPDQLEGRGDRDYIEGGIGNDRVFGGDGADTLFGQDGNDFIAGEAGNDRAEGGVGNDTITGAGGRDTLLGGTGRDRLNGGNDNDWLRGDSGGDTLLGRSGSDVLIGDGGDDLLEGYFGRDILYGGANADTLLGGADDDLLVAGENRPPSLAIGEAFGDEIQDEWLSTRSYDQRAINIRNGAGRSDNRLNTIYLIGANRSGQTIFDDDEPDSLTGGGGLDFFYAIDSGVNVDVFDRASNERFDRI